MQTFLPYADFKKSAKCLDYRRLGKQRVEARQLIDTILNSPTKTGKPRKGWYNHPAARMWAGNINALREYYNVMIEEWIYRGYKNTMQLEIIENEITYPLWLGNEAFHASHRAALLSKDFVFYSKFNWKEKPGINYIWPINK